MKRWAVPTIYFALCEILDTLYELGRAGLMIDVVWVFAVLIEVALISPAIEIARWVELHMAALLSLPFTEHRFLPRWIGSQAAILVCTLALVFFTWVITMSLRSKGANLDGE